MLRLAAPAPFSAASFSRAAASAARAPRLLRPPARKQTTRGGPTTGGFDKKERSAEAAYALEQDRALMERMRERLREADASQAAAASRIDVESKSRAPRRTASADSASGRALRAALVRHGSYDDVLFAELLDM